MATPIGTLLDAARFDQGYLEQFESKLFFDGPDAARRLINFAALLTLATLIATFGVIGDSTAAIIGAMIVAPLMTPIMATAAAVVTGQGRRAAQSLALVVAGVALTIGLATLVTSPIPHDTISFTANSAITSRVTPGLLDLLVALASGAAGAYILIRPELADALSGVAIAISLVPPLCVVGISLATGHWLAAAGALLLFVTNFLSILLAGSAVFWFAGVGDQARKVGPSSFRRGSLATIVAATLLIVIPLTVLTSRAVIATRETATVEAATQTWLGGRAYDVTGVVVEDLTARVTVTGDGALPPVGELATACQAQLGHPLKLVIYVVPRKTLEGGA